MQNPVIQNRTYASIYFGAWGVIIIAHVTLATFFSSFGFYANLLESIVSNVLFAVIGICIWFPVYYTDPDKNRMLSFLTNHAAACSLSVGLWLWLSDLILNLIFKQDQLFGQTFEDTLGWRIAIGLLYYLSVSSNYYIIVYYESFKKKLSRESELKNLVKEVELKSLKSQINPHFLFNSLNSISSLTMFSPERAQEMVINLSEFLRYSLSHGKETLTTLEQECKNIERYLKIEKTRFGKRLNVNINVGDDCKNQKLPGLILQPIMENAIKYGVYESTDQSNIEISAICNPSLLSITICNEYDPDFISNKGEGIGLINVKSRLHLIYERNDLLEIEKDKKTFTVRMNFPQN